MKIETKQKSKDTRINNKDSESTFSNKEKDNEQTPHFKVTNIKILYIKNLVLIIKMNLIVTSKKK